jgi:enamine deaminase RidA (YjgF/YER057c/UK114 family)
MHKAKACIDFRLVDRRRELPVLRPITPPALRAPFARYSHGIEIPAGARLVFCSGQLGIGTDETIPESAADQTELIFQAIQAILGEAGMGLADLVRLNAYVSAREHMAGYMAVRDRVVASPPPASTLMIVSGFAREAFKVEVEAVAAKL